MKKTVSIIAVCIAVLVVLGSCFSEPLENDSLKTSDDSIVTSETQETTEKRTEKVTTTEEKSSSTTKTESTTTTKTEKVTTTQEVEDIVWIPQSGSKYHSRANCSNMKDPSQVTKAQAIAMGYEPCKRCH